MMMNLLIINGSLITKIGPFAQEWDTNNNTE